MKHLQMNMKALFFDEDPAIRNVPVPKPSRGEVLIKVLYSAICNTDLEIVKGYMGFRGILGHEFSGEVVTESSKLFGKKVVGEINCPCGTCYLCRSGRQTHCSSRSVLGIFNRNGVFAEYVCLPEANLHIIPENLTPELAVFTEPLAAAIEIFDQVHIRPTQNVFIFGAGKLGLLISLVFKLNGCEATTFDLSQAKIDMARSLNIHAANLSDLSLTDKAEVCIDCTGHPEGINIALAHLYPRGKLVLKTTVAETAKVDLNQVVINEFQIIGSRCGPFQPALKLLKDKLVDPMPLISGTYPLSNIIEAFKFASLPETLKVLIRND